jgi:hypothetical protein
MWETKFHTRKTLDKTVVLYILVFTFLNRAEEELHVASIPQI